ncbi:MAG: YHS domain protein [Planctomycetes bacterium]|nr:YHS domain protein [Planctomycetota bacterium]MBI3847630.1 YHS domain protein [Planctomycetota bacterium]
MNKTISFLSSLVVAGIAATGLAQSSATPSGVAAHKYNLMGESVGVAGYDPVSYFPEGGGKPEKGLISISVQQDGVTYRFASEEHRTLFEKNSVKYLPAYGGWCAWAVAELGKRVDVDPESFEVRDGKLYLFFRDKKLDTRALWREKPGELLAKSEKNWPELSK